ncbi:OmpA family protein [Polaromonas sp.]|uniref:OmpA family protein n=1 Tax=Polaromonas sp. TaxID=1869339 RepID=UPI003CC1EA01
MASQSDDEQLGLVLGLVFAVVAGVIALAIAAALLRAGSGRAAPAADVAALPVTAVTAPMAPASAAVPSPAQSALAASDAASITVEYGVVKFYFASGKAELAPGAGDAMIDVVRAARNGQKVLIAGFHDSRGNAAANAELARKRALAVYDVLKEAGVPENRITLQKPEQMAGSGSDAEARRVEITLQ